VVYPYLIPQSKLGVSVTIKIVTINCPEAVLQVPQNQWFYSAENH